MQRDEADAPKAKPKVPCLVCDTPTSLRPVCEAYPLCPPCLAAWWEDARFQGGDLAANARLTLGWLKERRAGRAA